MTPRSTHPADPETKTAKNSWSQWVLLPELENSFTLDAFKETLDGGQAFRWNILPANSSSNYAAYEGRWGENIIRLAWYEGKVYAAHPSSTDFLSARSAVLEYIGNGDSLREIIDELPWRSDPVLRSAFKSFRGLRILKQPLEETLLMFLCSSTKQIPQIKAIGEHLAQRFGGTLPDGSRALPTWSQIAGIKESELRSCQLGYRATFIANSARAIRTEPDFFNKLRTLSTTEARKKLMTLPGVGAKIADCTLLFGDHRLEVFPIDTWIHKALITLYDLEDWETRHLQSFARAHFGRYAGLAQQYLFSEIRHKRPNSAKTS